jgi:hypothetical protein
MYDVVDAGWIIRIWWLAGSNVDWLASRLLA